MPTKEEEEEAAERSRGEAREARHGALIGRAEQPRRVSTMCLLSIHNCDPRVISEYLLAQPPAAPRRGGPRGRRERNRRTSRRGEKIESVSREVEMKKKEDEEGEGEKVVARVRKYETAGRGFAGPVRVKETRSSSFLGLFLRGRKCGTTEFPNVAESGDALSPLFADGSLQVRSYRSTLLPRDRSRRDVAAHSMTTRPWAHRATHVHTHTYTHTYTCTRERQPDARCDVPGAPRALNGKRGEKRANEGMYRAHAPPRTTPRARERVVSSGRIEPIRCCRRDHETIFPSFGASGVR